MKVEALIERLHQLNAVDRNALAIYTDMLAKVEDPDISSVLKHLVRDEAKHVVLENELLSLLGKGKES